MVVETFRTAHLLETIEARQWLSLFFVNDPIKKKPYKFFMRNSLTSTMLSQVQDMKIRRTKDLKKRPKTTSNLLHQ